MARLFFLVRKLNFNQEDGIMVASSDINRMDMFWFDWTSKSEEFYPDWKGSGMNLSEDIKMVFINLTGK